MARTAAEMGIHVNTAR
ncbi:hypothetical protein [Paracoccus sp. PAMC 22219]